MGHISTLFKHQIPSEVKAESETPALQQPAPSFSRADLRLHGHKRAEEGPVLPPTVTDMASARPISPPFLMMV